jgi:uncharacterized protein (TIGR00251 family)
MSSCLRSVEHGVEITVKVVPGASRNRIVGPLGDALKVQVSAAPERGKANTALTALLADVLGVSVKCVSVVRGSTSQRKIVLIRGVSLSDAAGSLGVA